MVFDEVDAAALPVVRAQLRRLHIGEPCQFLRLARADIAAELVQFAANRLGIGFGELHQERIGAPRTRPRQWRALVQDLMRQCYGSGTWKGVSLVLQSNDPDLRGKIRCIHAQALAGACPLPYSTALP